MTRWERVLVTGASAGIGREIALALAPHAASMILVARRRERLDELADRLRSATPALQVEVEPCDLSDRAALEGVADRVLRTRGGVDLLVNNAGIGDLAFFHEAQWERMERIVEVNVIAPLLLTRRFLPGMVARKAGDVVFVSSGAAFNPMPGSATYVGSKHFINGLAETLIAELHGTGVGVTQVAPGPVVTEFDEAAGVPDGLMGGADDFMRISAEQCAREAVDGLVGRRALVLPGRRYRAAMAARSLAPMIVRRRMTRGLAARLRGATQS